MKHHHHVTELWSARPHRRAGVLSGARGQVCVSCLALITATDPVHEQGRAYHSNCLVLRRLTAVRREQVKAA